MMEVIMMLGNVLIKVRIEYAYNYHEFILINQNIHGLL